MLMIANLLAQPELQRLQDRVLFDRRGQCSARLVAHAGAVAVQHERLERHALLQRRRQGPACRAGKGSLRGLGGLLPEISSGKLVENCTENNFKGPSIPP